MTQPLPETPGREDYYNAALSDIVLWCHVCQASLDPDHDLGAGVSFESDGYYVLLGDEAVHRGWKISGWGGNDYSILCPTCAAKSC